MTSKGTKRSNDLIESDKIQAGSTTVHWNRLLKGDYYAVFKIRWNMF